ncbi:hypothetical protein ACFY2Z_26560 [Streptomyces sp. NPDC001222]
MGTSLAIGSVRIRMQPEKRLERAQHCPALVGVTWHNNGALNGPQR